MPQYPPLPFFEYPYIVVPRRARRRRAHRVEPVRHRSRTSSSRNARRGVLREVRALPTVTSWCCTSSAAPNRGKSSSMDFSFTEEQETVGKVARQLFEASRHPRASHRARSRCNPLRSRAVARAGDVGSSRASRCPRRSAEVEAASSSWASYSPKSAGVSRLFPSTPRCVLGADTVARHGSSAVQQEYLPGVVDGTRILTGGALGVRSVRPDPTADNRTPRR